MLFNIRIAAWQDTEKNAPQLKGKPSIKYRYDANYKMIPKYDTTIIKVVDKDLVDLGEIFIEHKPLLLNPADDSFPGGCVETGSGAAEESIFRRSNYFRSLKISLYPLQKDEAIYSPCITVFKDINLAQCESYELDFIACPGLRHPEVSDEGKLTSDDTHILEKKIELLLQVAHKNAHDILILTAFGCGAWKNPPQEVASAFKRVLKKHDGVFRIVMFAIKRNAEKEYTVRLDASRPNNYTIFKTVFND
jgi:uncharacterized protein (TIGR02452 family)